MLEKIEKKIKDFKERQDPKKVGVSMFVIFGIVVLLLMNYINVYGREKQESTDANNQTLYEIVTAVNNIDTLVAKVRITTSSEYNLITISRVLAEANSAKESLSRLPVNQNAMRNASKFFSQTIGFSEMLIRKEAVLDEKDYSNLEKINEVATNLNKVLTEIYSELNKGSIKWDEVEKIAQKRLTDNSNELKLSTVEKIATPLENYEGLIYDGAFSEHIIKNTPKNLKGKDVTVAEATKKVNECVRGMNVKEGIIIEEVIYNGEIEGDIPLYDFDVKLKDKKYNVDVQITKQEGKLWLLLANMDAKEKKIKIEDAKKIGDEYLKNLGLESFQPTYYLETANMVTINYAAFQDNVILYPDLIKVKVSLDTGEISSVEASGYIYNHVDRKISVKYTKEEAREKINKDLEVENVRLAVIPTDSKSEVLTYEFKGKVDGKTFLIYINANTLKEENVLLLLETPGGILTI